MGRSKLKDELRELEKEVGKIIEKTKESLSGQERTLADGRIWVGARSQNLVGFLVWMGLLVVNTWFA
ncbi:uncharacterized protein G2W53_028898 [Senna tora]|uniref:Uncharacterized protein n=1 Tax=Senna tora TaxID=362788 RepID=A0A834T361_9FABA|nr:uncharacterized protein G2W53_028898 [Senna tora]